MRSDFQNIPKKETQEHKTVVTLRIGNKMKKELKKLGHGNLSHAVRYILEKALNQQ
jgi:hypothetical protein